MTSPPPSDRPPFSLEYRSPRADAADLDLDRPAGPPFGCAVLLGMLLALGLLSIMLAVAGVSGHEWALLLPPCSVAILGIVACCYRSTRGIGVGMLIFLGLGLLLLGMCFASRW